jgi:iron complex outermembrane receptor protein
VQNDLVGLSKNAFNATLYYEDSVQRSRLGRLSRQVPDRRAQRHQHQRHRRGAGDLHGGRLGLVRDQQRLKLTFEGLNLTDAFNDQYTDSRRDSVYVYSHTGRQYNFGLRYSF